MRAHLSLSFSLRLLSFSPSARTHLSLSLSLSFSLRLLSFSSAIGREEQRFNSVKHRYYVASLILHASIAEITAQLLSLFYVFDFIRRRCDYHDFLCRLTLWKGELVSITISYSFRCLTTETVKYINENSFIENLASSKYSMWAQRRKQM